MDSYFFFQKTDILLLIFRFLDVKSLVKVSQVCKLWYLVGNFFENFLKLTKNNKIKSKF